MFKAIFYCLLLLTANACSLLPDVYRIDIQQGNLVSEEMLQQLQPGMSKRQVSYVLGTPLVADPFSQSRWDYFYQMQSTRQTSSRQHIRLHFEADKLLKIEGPDNSH